MNVAVAYDPYDVALNRDPYPTFARIRETTPLYYNPAHEFYALSRYADVDAALHRPPHQHLGSGSGPTSVSATHWPGSRAGSPSTRFSTASRTGMSTSRAELCPTSTVRGWETMPPVVS